MLVIEILEAELLVGGKAAAQATSDDLGHAAGWNSGARFLHRQVRFGQHRARGERCPRDKALREDVAQRRHVARNGILVNRVRTHALDEADAVDELS